MEWDIKTLDQKKIFNGILVDPWSVDPWTLKSRLRLELVTQKFEKIVENARNLKAWSDCRSGLVALWPAMVNVSHEIAMVCESVSNPGRLG